MDDELVGWQEPEPERRHVETTLEQEVESAFSKVKHATHYDDEVQAKANLITWLNAHYARKGIE